MLDELRPGFSGELFYTDSAAHNAIIMSFATDASVYQERLCRGDAENGC
jgi:hypothetical protein